VLGVLAEGDRVVVQWMGGTHVEHLATVTGRSSPTRRRAAVSGAMLTEMKAG
jgi:hypothetical protein